MYLRRIKLISACCACIMEQKHRFVGAIKMEIIAYEMKYVPEHVEKSDIACIPFEEGFFPEYMRIYNECFYGMRKALDIQPYHFLNDYRQIAEKVRNIHLLISQGEIIGSVACYGNEIDDLFVNKKFQQRGYGKQLLLWGIEHIRETSSEPVTLHVAKWNHNALTLYRNVGFEIANAEKVR